jgi:epoxyqueuosine reductase
VKSHTKSNITQVRAQALALGFDACGFARADKPDPEDRLGRWLDQDFHADMAWIKNTQTLRQDPSLKLDQVRSVIVVAKNYYQPLPEDAEGALDSGGLVARYAWGRDYHKVMKKPLRRLAEFLKTLDPDTESYASVDSGPVLERAWAALSGLGWIGKNSLVLRRDIGSWFFLGTILTTLKLNPDAPVANHCGSCRACLDACPTQAISEAGEVDSRLCISYQTIENRGEIPEALHAAHGAWVFGCDICQEVCPWNRFAQPATEPDFRARPGVARPSLEALLSSDEELFNRIFEGTPVRRAKYGGMQRNAAIAQQNALDLPEDMS